MSQDKAPASAEDKKWYSLRVISGKEKKIQERILLEIERSGWQNAVFNVIVPTEKVYKVRNGKKVMQERVGGTSYASAHDPALIFGLGSDAGPYVVEIRWPNGEKQTLPVKGSGESLVVVQPFCR